jgi:glycosyltransferase involved in cell wall biosynthesis
VVAELAVVAINDPESPKTWSGTPKALIDTMRLSGRQVHPLSADVPAPWDRLLYGAIGVPLYGRGARGFRQYYGPRNARLRRRVSQHRSEHSEASYIHTDHIWTPFEQMGKADFFFRDSSWRDYGLHQGLGRRLQARIGRSFAESLQRVGHVFVTSDWARRGLIAEGADAGRITVVGTGVGNLIQPFTTKDNYDTKRTLCIAKVRFHNKGLDLLLQAFELAHAKCPELRLDLVVPPGVVAAQSGVTQHHHLSAAELINLYRSVSLFAMPARYEPWGLVYLEAQLSGLPVLGSMECAFPELCDYGRTGFIVPALTAEVIAESLLEAHSDPHGLERKGRAALDFARRFSWENTVNEILSVVDGRASRCA